MRYISTFIYHGLTFSYPDICLQASYQRYNMQEPDSAVLVSVLKLLASYTFQNLFENCCCINPMGNTGNGIFFFIILGFRFNLDRLSQKRSQFAFLLFTSTLCGAVKCYYFRGLGQLPVFVSLTVNDRLSYLAAHTTMQSTVCLWGKLFTNPRKKVCPSGGFNNVFLCSELEYICLQLFSVQVYSNRKRPEEYVCF